MKLDYSLLSQRLKAPLPGPQAHEPLRATPIGLIKPRFEHRSPPKPGSVLILLYEEKGNAMFPLTKRPDYLGAHGGQISLPGGKAEAGETRIETALREAEEEIGIRASQIEILGVLTEFFVIPSNFLITPVIGYLKGSPEFVPDSKEVKKIINASVENLLHADAVLTKEILAANKFQMSAPHFEIENEIVWGATAMMLNEFREVLKELNY
ncbi:MAG: CoA pyrophosphatase [Flammeovirgaceae bacterium]|jgi:8-oxo-dGTP pyrophosphatase MutT (NUDIX family)|nr:CoA pyrophosphatase [Flammeovirgaceae bacterium]